MKLSDLQKIEIETTENGFVVWITENYRGSKVRHWLIDGSCLKDEGVVIIGGTNRYQFEAKYVRKENEIVLFDNPKPKEDEI